jgi:hypothetical protein
VKSLPSVPAPRTTEPGKFGRLFADGRRAPLAGTHLTLRAGLERYRSLVPVGDPLVARYAAARRSAASALA